MNARRDEVEKLKIDLLKSAELLVTGEGNPALRHTLDKFRPDIKRALVLNWIPEQGEDIYWILTNTEEVLIVEVPRPGNDESVAALEVVDIEVFRKRRLSAETKRRFDAALEIMKER